MSDCYCDRSDHDRCPGGLLCCCSPALASELEQREAMEWNPCPGPVEA